MKFDYNEKQKTAKSIALKMAMEYISENELFKYSNPSNHLSNISSSINTFEEVYKEFYIDLINKNDLLEHLKECF